MTHQHVTILMCTYNGAAFLNEQLESFVQQDIPDWSLFVSDDGSQDNTISLVHQWHALLDRELLTTFEGPKRGSAANFLSLLSQTKKEDGYIAFSDQDDIWLPHKLKRAIEKLDVCQGPAVYSSRSLHQVAQKPLKPSRYFDKPPHLGNALVQNILSGHSIVMNPEAAEIVRQSSPFALAAQVPFHDWWVYQIACATGIEIVIDQEPGLIYRQHAANELGGNFGAFAGFTRIGMIAGGAFGSWIDRNLDALEACAAFMTPESKSFLDDFRQWRGLSVTGRVRRGPRKLGLYRQSALGNIALEIAGRLGRL